LAESLPTGHYARKNIAYLHAIRSGARCIYETDDDNAPRILGKSEKSGWLRASESLPARAVG
jgi:hypothetical protein